jgi:hypothetical protein
MLWRSSAVSWLIDLVPQHGLVALELYRALGILPDTLAAGKLPALFALPAAAGDVVVGFTQLSH